MWTLQTAIWITGVCMLLYIIWILVSKNSERDYSAKDLEKLHNYITALEGILAKNAALFESNARKIVYYNRLLSAEIMTANNIQRISDEVRDELYSDLQLSELQKLKEMYVAELEKIRSDIKLFKDASPVFHELSSLRNLINSETNIPIEELVHNIQNRILVLLKRYISCSNLDDSDKILLKKEYPLFNTETCQFDAVPCESV